MDGDGQQSNSLKDSNPIITDSNLTPEQIDEEAKAEEEFISDPEDTVVNPLVPAWSKELDEVSDLEGVISSGTISEEEKREKLINNEGNMMEGSNSNPTEEPVPILGGAKKKEKKAESASVLNQAPVAEPAPVVEQAPAAEPAPAPAATPAMAQSNVASGEKKKGGKGGVIAAIIIVLLLLIGGGVALVFILLINGNPASNINSAIASTLKSESIQVKGEYKGKVPVEMMGDSSKKDMNLKFDAVISDGKISGTASSTLPSTSGDSVDAKMGFALGNGNIYLKIDNLSDVLDASMGSMGSFFKSFNNQWFIIDGSVMGESAGSASCVLESIGGIINKSTGEKFAKAYEDNAFIEIKKDTKEEEKDGIKYYTVESNSEKKSKFKDAIKEIDSAKKISACNSSSSSSSDDKTNIKTVQIGTKDGKIGGIILKGTDGNGEDFEANMTFAYEKKEASIPSDAKPIQEIFNSFGGLFGGSSLLGGGSSSSLGGGSSSSSDDDDDWWSSLLNGGGSSSSSSDDWSSLFGGDDDDDDDDLWSSILNGGSSSSSSDDDDDDIDINSILELLGQ